MRTNKPIEWYGIDFPPARPHCVLAWDQEAHYIAVFENDEWHNAHTGEPIDSIVTHWTFLPEPQEVQP